MKVYIVAGEPSGDLLAWGLMKALGELSEEVQFKGVGGENMRLLGFESLFDISEISVMGAFEVIPRLPLIFKRLRQTVEDIEHFEPDVLVTVDSWGFVSSLLKKLRRRGSKIPVVHYVAPQVWAWKRGRAKSVAQLVDRLMMLLPNEGKYFEKYGLRCDFVGHPVTERMAQVEYDTEGFRQRYSIPMEARVVCMLPGSRRSEVSRLLPVILSSLEKIETKVGGLFVIIPTIAAVQTEVYKRLKDAKLPFRVVEGAKEKYNAFKISEIAIAASGTVSLELAAVGIPHVIVYKFNPLTNHLVKMVIRTKFANLLNIITGREIIPEFVLDNCRPELIADCASSLLEDEDAAAKQVIAARQALEQLRLPDILPSQRAAQIVIQAAVEGKFC